MEKILLDAGPSAWGWHGIESVLRCPQLWAYKHILGPAGGLTRGWVEDRDPLIKGSLVHIGLAHHYRRIQAIQQGEDPERWHEPGVAIRLLAMQHAGWEVHVTLTSVAVAAYQNHYLNERFRILAVEEQMQAEVGGRPYTARADLVVEDPATGRVLVIEHKSCGRMVGKTFSRYTMSGQVLGLQVFGRALYGDRFGGVRLNVIQLSPPDFGRKPPELAPWGLACFAQTIADAWDRIEALKAAGRDPWNWPKIMSEQNCGTGVYGPCPAYDLCRWGPS